MFFELLKLKEEFTVNVPQLLKRIVSNVRLEIFLGNRVSKLLRRPYILQALAFLKRLPLQVLLLHNHKHVHLVK